MNILLSVVIYHKQLKEAFWHCKITNIYKLQTGNPEEARDAAKPADQNQLPKRSASVAGDGPRIMQTPKTLENPAQAREIHEEQSTTTE